MSDKKPRADKSDQQEKPVGKQGIFGYLDRSTAQSGQSDDIKVSVSRVGAPGAESTASVPVVTGAPPPRLSSSRTLTILVLEDYPDVMDTVVANIRKYLHPKRDNNEASLIAPEEHYYTVHGIERINIVQASTPYEALNYIGNYDQNTRSFASLHDRVYRELMYGVFDVVLGHYLSGIDVLEIIKRHVPHFHALILTAQTNTDQEIARTVELADAYRKKQASLDPAKRYILAQDIAENVNRLLEEMRSHEQLARSKALVSTMPDLLAVVLDYYDFITGAHCRGVTDLAMFIGEELKSGEAYAGRAEYDEQNLDLEMLGFNAVLHDIGKVSIPKRILTKTGIFSKEEDDLIGLLCQQLVREVEEKQGIDEADRKRLVDVIRNFNINKDSQQELKLHGRLTGPELNVMRFHIPAGELIRDDFRPSVEKKLNDPELVDYIMRLFDGLYHHEKPDGGGYPYGIGGEEFRKLPTASKIILCADVYHALRSRRSYKLSMDHHKAITILRELAHDDPVVNDCVDILTDLPQHVIDSVNEMNVRRISRLIQRVRTKAEAMGASDPEQLLADLLGSNAIDPNEYKTKID